MIPLLVKALVSYLLGSALGSLVVGRLRGGVDIRALGSGNPGSTNALRTQGKSFALCVLLIDAGKGWLATRWIASPRFLLLPPASASWRPWVAVACGLSVVIGHLYPIWFGFRGGKGVATLAGAVLGLQAGWLVPVGVAWLATLALSGYVGLASMVGAGMLAVVLLLYGSVPMRAFGLLAALLIAFTHRFNLARMRAGTEPRARSFILRSR